MTLLKVTSGSDVRVVLMIESDGVPVDLTERGVAIFGAAPQIANRASAVINDPVGGLIEVMIEGTDPIPTGTYGFRVQINGAGDSVGLPAFNLKVV